MNTTSKSKFPPKKTMTKIIGIILVYTIFDFFKHKNIINSLIYFIIILAIVYVVLLSIKIILSLINKNK